MMDNNETRIEEEILLTEDEAIDEQYFKIRYWSSTHSFSRIAEWMKSKKLNIPDLQRSFVWSKDMSSKLIDSILLGIPLPTFFLYQNDDKEETVDIIDGLQRIIAISSYLNEEKLPDQRDVFKLSNISSINKNWRGKRFGDLSEIQQNKLKDSDASIVFFEQRVPNVLKADIKRYVFERLNTGGIKLTSQEIRNAVYPGDLLEAIKSEAKNWVTLEKRFNEMDYKRYKIDELILRIIVIFFIVDNDYKVLKRDSTGQIKLAKAPVSISLKNQMDMFMEYKKNETYIVKNELHKAIIFYYNNLQNDKMKCNFLSKNIDSYSINAVMAESVFIGILNAQRKGEQILEKERIKLNFEKMLNSEEMMEPFSRRTTNIANIKRRLKITYRVLTDFNFDFNTDNYEKN